MVRKILFAFTSLALLQASAQQLDLGFGINGKVMTSFGLKESNLGTIAIQSDGKILACGSYHTYTSSPFFIGNEIALSRYNTDGSLDLSFGTQGKVLIPIGSNTENENNTVRVLEDGKILIMANNTIRVSQFVTRDEYALIKYNPDGTPDSGFGANGIALIGFEGHANRADAMDLQQDGKIILVGGSEQISINDYGNFVAVRLNANGTKDLGFGNDGRIHYNIGTTFRETDPTEDFAQAVIVQPDGKILLGGSNSVSAAETGGAALIRLNTDGTLDTSFGNNGRVITSFDSHMTVTSVSLLPDGKIVASGVYFFNDDSNEKIVVLKYDANGAPDVTFGNEGKLILDGGYDEPVFFSYTSIIQPDGKILVSGWGNKDNNQDENFDAFIIRLNANGSIDTSFGDNGYLWSGFGLDLISNDLLLQPDGKLLVGGTTIDLTEPNEFVLWRYEPLNLSVATSNNTMFAITPNPFKDFITITNVSKRDHPQSAILSDLSGRMVTSMAFNQTALNENVRMPMPESLPKGVYILTIENNYSSVSVKIVK